MALLELHTYPDEALRLECEPVTRFDEDLARLVGDMAQTMYAEDGVGLAAPQVGINKRLLILDVAPREERGRKLLVAVNPEVVAGEGEIEWEEGCLSLPEVTIRMQRQATVTVKAQDLQGQEYEVEAEGLLAVALQHEIDHLDGVLLIDHLPVLKRRLVVRDLKRLKKEAGEK